MVSAVPPKNKGSNELDLLVDAEDLKSYGEVLEITCKNPLVATTFKHVGSEQIFQQRVQDLKFQGIDSIILFVSNVTNVQKLQQLEA